MTAAAMLMTVTAYCCVGANGGYCNQTASGVQVRPGAMAAGPSVPYWRDYFIPGYGVGTVLDRGGAVHDGYTDRRGAWHPPVLDVWFYDCGQANAWGRRQLWVSPASAVSAEAAWVEIVEEVRYWHDDAYVTRRRLNTPRGVIDVYEVERGVSN